MTTDNAKLTDAELEELLRAIARRHALNAVCPLGSQDEPDDAIVIQETIRAQEVIFYALKEAADDPRLLAMAKDGYTKDQQRVARYIVEISGDTIGGGDDPVGFLIASHRSIKTRAKAAPDMVLVPLSKLAEMEKDYVISGSPGPLYGAGWAAACQCWARILSAAAPKADKE